MAQIDLANAVMLIRDGGTNHIEIKIGEGNLQHTETRNIEFLKARGILDTVRENDQEPMDVNFNCVWEYISSAVGATFENALKKTGAASSWVSSSVDPAAPYCVDIELIYTPGGDPPCGGDGDSGGAVEHIFFNEFHYETLGHSLKDGTIDCKGKCNTVSATTARTTT